MRIPDLCPLLFLLCSAAAGAKEMRIVTGEYPPFTAEDYGILGDRNNEVIASDVTVSLGKGFMMFSRARLETAHLMDRFDAALEAHLLEQSL